MKNFNGCIFLFTSFCGLLPALSEAVPITTYEYHRPGYSLIRPDLNDSNQIIYESYKRFEPLPNSAWVFDNGKHNLIHEQITGFLWSSSISNNGIIAMRPQSPNRMKVGVWQDGTYNILAEPRDGYQPSVTSNGVAVSFGRDSNGVSSVHIFNETLSSVNVSQLGFVRSDVKANNHGQAVFIAGVSSSSLEVYLIYNGVIKRITSDSFINGQPFITDDGVIYFTSRENLKNIVKKWDPVTGLITTFFEGEGDALLLNVSENGKVLISDTTEIFEYNDPFFPDEPTSSTFYEELLIFEDNKFTLIGKFEESGFGIWDTDINLLGEIVWSQFIDGENDSEIFKWDGNSIVQVTFNDVNDFDPAINNSSEMTWWGNSNNGSRDRSIYATFDITGAIADGIDATVSEPSSLAVLCSGIIAVFYLRRKKNSEAASIDVN